MKKIVVICMVCLLIAGMSISVSADHGNFVSSPSNNPAPSLVGSKSESEDCVAQIIITPYIERASLDEASRAQIEAAYNEVVAAENLQDLNSGLVTLARGKRVAASTLEISDLFDIDSTNCEAHEEHGSIAITLESDTLKNFVALMQYYDGDWHVVQDADVDDDGNQLSFRISQFSPVAIVVSTSNIVDEPAVKIVKLTAIAVVIGEAAWFEFVFPKLRKK